MKVCVVQAPLEWEDVAANLEAFERRLATVERGDVIVLPELFTSGFTMKGKERAASFYKEVCARMQVWARERDALVMGSTVYEEEGHYYNRLVAAFPDGEIACYDKRHCFTMGEEHKHFTPGQDLLVVSFRGLRIATFICYDLRFPVWSRNTSGYDVAVYVANWPEARRKVWRVLLQARAIENQCYVVGVNCVGEDGNGLRYAGDSMVVSPKGEIVWAGTPFAEEVAMVTLDEADLRLFREKFPVLKDQDLFTLN